MPPSAVRSHPSTAKTPAFAPILVMATLTAEPQDSTLSDPRVAVYLWTGGVRIEVPAAIALKTVVLREIGPFR